jgi:pimeloyl-ACP methyl ester carboxylesterase
MPRLVKVLDSDYSVIFLIKKNHMNKVNFELSRLIYRSLLFILFFLNQTLAFANTNSSNFAKLIDIDQGRKIFLKCSGTGTPTVILESGYRNNSDVWTISRERKQAIFPAVASFTRVCVYDRPGTVGATLEDLSRSDRITMPRTVESLVTDLHYLLQAAKIKGPYILAGHSLGGLSIRLFASRYPNEVAGLILIDAYPESFKSLLGPKKWHAYLKIMTTAIPDIKDPSHFETIDFDKVTRVMEETAAKTPLKPMPLIILSRGLPADLPVQKNSELTSKVLEEAWRTGQNQLASLVPQAEQVIATKSQHDIMLTQPELIINAIHKMVNELRKD